MLNNGILNGHDLMKDKYTEYRNDLISEYNCEFRGPLMVVQWLRHCATNRKVTGSIPDGVIGIFH
jgi:hypothetical protein